MKLAVPTMGRSGLNFRARHGPPRPFHTVVEADVVDGEITVRAECGQTTPRSVRKWHASGRLAGAAGGIHAIVAAADGMRPLTASTRGGIAAENRRSWVMAKLVVAGSVLVRDEGTTRANHHH